MYDETKAYLNQLVDLCKSKGCGNVIWDELVGVY